MFEGAADESGDRAWIRRQEQKKTKYRANEKLGLYKRKREQMKSNERARWADKQWQYLI